VPATTGAWFDVAGNYVEFANQTGDYDELAAHIGRRRRR